MNGRLRSTIPVWKTSEELTGSTYVLPKDVKYETFLKVKGAQLGKCAWAKRLHQRHFWTFLESWNVRDERGLRMSGQFLLLLSVVLPEAQKWSIIKHFTLKKMFAERHLCRNINCLKWQSISKGIFSIKNKKFKCSILFTQLVVSGFFISHLRHFNSRNAKKSAWILPAGGTKCFH